MREVKTKEFALGTIKYRLPNVVESMRLLGHMGVAADGSTPGGSEFFMLSSLIEHIEPFIVSIDCRKGEEEIKTWADALEHFEFVGPLSEIANEIMRSFQTEAPERASKKKR